MKQIDLCIVATLRPEILYKTLSSFEKMTKFDGLINFVMNIDTVPRKEAYTLINDIMRMGIAIGSFNPAKAEVHFSVLGEGNFAKAVKTVWENSTSEYVFHMEDDWKFIREIDLNKCIERMEKENFDYMRFPKVHAPHLNCMHKVALQPSLWKGDVVRRLAKHMRIDKDPEKQLRAGQGNEELDKVLFEIQKKGLKDYCSEWCVEDIGREWRDKQGLMKWNAVEPGKENKNNQNAKNVTWWKR